MTYQEFKTHMMPLAVQLGAEWDPPTWKLYHRAVEDVALPLFISAVEEAARTRTKIPSAAQLRDMAEVHRRAILAAHPWDGCIDCEDQRGWVAVTAEGVTRMQRCGCVARHQAKLASLGALKPLALPSAPISDPEPSGTYQNELPQGELRERVTAIARRRVL